MPRPARIFDPMTGRERGPAVRTETFFNRPDEPLQHAMGMSPRRWRKVLAQRETLRGRRIA